MIIGSLIRIWSHLTKKSRLQFFSLLCLAIITSVTEVVSIGALIPFLSAITDPGKLILNSQISFVLNKFDISDPHQILLIVTMLFCLAAMLAGFMRVKLLRAQINLNNSLAMEFSIKIYTRILYQPYTMHIERNSSEIISALTQKAGTLIGSGINPVATILSSSLMILSILFGLIYLNPLIALSSILGFSSIYLCISLLAKRRLSSNSWIINDSYAKVVKVLQESLGGIRDVILDRSQDKYISEFKNLELSMRNATASVQLITSAPKYLIEMFGMLLIALLAYLIVAYYADSEGVIPLLGVLALSAQRMLPMLQQIYSGWTAILSGKDSVKDSLDFLDQLVLIQNTYETHGPIKFLDTISLKSLGFRYGVEQPAVLKDLNLKFKRGEIVGIIGTTGSGKSTLLDLIMGLLLPTSGILSVDDVELTYENLNRWQKNIAHVPQTIFLNDATVLSNIAFGVSGQEIDVERVIQAAKLAQIHEDIESWPLGYGTNVGERGVKLSGGQKQRIGIARAFYKKSEVLIFDEATSALDPITESKVMSSFNQLSYRPTVFIIAHRLSTLKQCTRVLKVENGYIIQDGTFQDVVDLKSSLGL